jgi:HK97 family phage major capsid protein
MTLQELKDKCGDLQNQIESTKAEAEAKEGGITQEDYEAMSALLAEQDGVKAQIETAERLEAMPKAEPQAQTAAQMGVIAQGPAAEADPYSLGEYLQDIFAVADSTRKGNPVYKPRVDNYQKKVIFNAPTGSNEGIGSEGGFLVGEDMAGGIMSRVYNNSQLLSRASRRTISSGANSLVENGVDETSRADGSRHGGIRGYWVAEGGEKTASRPKWRQIRNELKKLAVLYYATDEVLADATFLQQSVEEAVADELDFKIQDSIISGDGAGKPLGWLNAPCLVTQAKETGQAADSIVYENVLKMWTRKWGPSTNYIWVVNDEIFPQLAQMNLAIGTGGAPVYLPANQAAGAPFNTLMGLPIIEVEQASALGDVGDINLVDMSQYRIAEKGGIQSAMSIHVQFIYDETVFRWVTRIDGQPLWNSALTRYKGANTKSPFVTLAERA